MPFVRLRLLLAAALIALIGAVPLAAQTAPQTAPKRHDSGVARPASMIFIGNSFFYYNNSLHNHVQRLLHAAEPDYKLRATSVTISGSGESWHDVDAYFRPGAIGSYSFTRDNRVVINKIDDGHLFDLAIIMDCSQCPIHPQLQAEFFTYSRKHSETLRRHNARPVFFMSWAYADRPEMTQQLAEAYTKAGNDNDALVIPAGLAFARAHAQRPTLVLHADDNRHPSMAGTYLAAATVYAALFRKSPEGLDYTAGLDADTAKFLQTVAWQTVQDYYGRLSAAK
jgi:hypothetical protein